MKNLLTLITIIISPTFGKAQTLYVPSGTGGIGTSTNSNVGIGISTPGALLHLRSGLFETKFIGGNQIDFTRDYANYITTSNALGFLYFGTGGRTQDVTLSASGNLGIGTISPTSKLHVAQGSSTDWAATISNVSGTGKGLLIKSAAATSDATLQVEDNYGNNRFMVRSDGKVGIGTASPGSWLDIKSGGGAHLFLSTTRGFSVSRSWGIVSNWYAEGDFSILESTTNTDMPSVSRFLIDRDGKVGIGTTNPTTELEVKGTIYSKEVKVDLSAGQGPDYVFEPNYKLLSLEEIKSYIEKNKHLPEVPSAKEMETNGVNVSEMNMLLLKKIEELTLYVIELKKKDELLLREIEQLKKQ